MKSLLLDALRLSSSLTDGGKRICLRSNCPAVVGAEHDRQVEGGEVDQDHRVEEREADQDHKVDEREVEQGHQLTHAVGYLLHHPPYHRLEQREVGLIRAHSMLISPVITRGGTDRLVRGLINRATDLTKCKVVLIRGKGMALIREDLAVLLIREDQVVLIKGRTLHLING